MSLTLAIFETKQPIVRFWELFSVVHFLALFMQGSIKFEFKSSSFQCSSLPLNIVLGFIVIIIILWLDDGIDQKSFCKKCFLNIYFWLVSYFMANLSRNKREDFLIKTMHVIVFILKSVDPSYYHLSLLSDSFRYGWNYLVIVFFL